MAPMMLREKSRSVNPPSGWLLRLLPPRWDVGVGNSMPLSRIFWDKLGNGLTPIIFSKAETVTEE